MVLIDSGSFVFGTDFERSFQKKVHISRFYISKFELTRAEWQAIMGSNPGRFRDCTDCPVDSVSWNMAVEFIGRINQLTQKNYRLPTEVEWEYAEKGGKKGAIPGSGGAYLKFSGSNNISEVAWYARNSGNKTHPVGLKKPNQLGL